MLMYLDRFRTDRLLTDLPEQVRPFLRCTRSGMQNSVLWHSIVG